MRAVSLDGGDEIEVILRFLHRRHENVQPAVARLDAERGAGDPRGGFLLGRASCADRLRVAARGFGRSAELLAALAAALADIERRGAAADIALSARSGRGGSGGRSRIGSAGMVHG